MSPLLAPVLAQLVTLGVSDRTEVRMIDVGSAGGTVAPDTARFGRYQPGQVYFEASNSPAVGLDFGWRNVNLTLGYSPTVLLTPLEDPDVVLFHNALVALNWQRRQGRNTYTASQSLNAGQQDFRRNLFAPPAGLPIPDLPGSDAPPAVTGGSDAGGGASGQETPPSTPTTTPGTQTPTGQLAREGTPSQVRYFYSTTQLGYSRVLSRGTNFKADAFYIVSGGIDEASRRVYPLVQTPRAFLSLSRNFGRRDTLTGMLASEYAFTSNSANDFWAWVTTASVGWSHNFTPEIRVSLDAGVAVAWYTLGDGRVALQIYPVIGSGAGSRVGVSFRDRIAGGLMVITLAASASPYINPTPPLAVDPRLGVSSGLAWTRKKFTLGANLYSGISLSTDPKDALNSIGFSADAAYAIGSGLSANAGFGAGWQAFSGETVVPPTYTAFVGLTWAAALPLN